MSFAPVFVDVMEDKGRDARFLRAAASDRAMFVQLALDEQPNLGAHDLYGDNALMRAALYNTQKVAELLLSAGFSPIYSNRAGRTPLHVFAKNGWTALVERALDAGACIDVRDDLGNTPLLEAAARGRRETAEFLVGRGADATAVNKEGESVSSFFAYHSRPAPVAQSVEPEPVEADPYLDAAESDRVIVEPPSRSARPRR